jgi:hypothetical protein
MALALDGLSPTIAVGFRKLLTAYAGNCFQAEKAVATTQNIGFSGTSADESALATFGGAADCWVNILYDQSGNARDMQESASQGIVRTGSANVALGGKLAAKMDSSRILDAPSNLGTYISAAAGTVLCCVSVVSNTSNDATVYLNSAAWQDMSQYAGLYFKNNAGAHTVHAYNFDGTVDSASADITTGTVLAIAWRHGGGNLEINVNNGGWVQAASGNTQVLTGVVTAGIEVGTFESRLGEIAAFNTALTDGQVLAWQIEAAGFRGLDLGGGSDGTKLFVQSLARGLSSPLSGALNQL